MKRILNKYEFINLTGNQIQSRCLRSSSVVFALVPMLLGLPAWVYAQSNVGSFSSVVTIQGPVTQTAIGNNVQQNLNVGSAEKSKANSFSSVVTTGAITQTGQNGAQQFINVGGLNNSQANKFDANVTVGRIEQVGKNGERQELDIGSVTNSTVRGTASTRVDVTKGVKQTGNGEIVLGSVKNANIGQFESNLSVRGKIEGNNIRMGSVVGDKIFDGITDRSLVNSQLDSIDNSGSVNFPQIKKDFPTGVYDNSTGAGSLAPQGKNKQFMPSLGDKKKPQYSRDNNFEFWRNIDYKFNTANKGVDVASDEYGRALSSVKAVDKSNLYLTLFTSTAIYNPKNHDEICVSKDLVSCPNQRWILLDYVAETGPFQSGFVAGTFFDKVSGKFIITYGGTTANESGKAKFVDTVKDIGTDLTLLVGTSQQASAIAYYDKIIRSYKDVNLAQSPPRPEVNMSKDNMLVTGHSLGGGLATTVASSRVGVTASTLNTAPYNVLTAPVVALGRGLFYGENVLSNSIVNYMVDNDPLTIGAGGLTVGDNILLPFDTGHSSSAALDAYLNDAVARNFVN